MAMFIVNGERWENYKKILGIFIKTCDNNTAYVFSSIANKFNLNRENRYWLSFLYSLTFCEPSAWYLFRQIRYPEDIEERFLVKWWEENKHKIHFSYDRLRVKNNEGVFVKSIISYKKLIGNDQGRTFDGILNSENQLINYQNLYEFLAQLYYFGSFSILLLTEPLRILLNLPIIPDKLDLKSSRSARNGLCYAIGADSWVIKQKEGERLKKWQADYLNEKLEQLLEESRMEYPLLDINYWKLDTSLCAYKRYWHKTRYLGFYIDRLQEEIEIMKKSCPEFDFSFFYEARRKTFDNLWLGEINGWTGIRKNRMGFPVHQIGAR